MEVAVEEEAKSMEEQQVRLLERPKVMVFRGKSVIPRGSYEYCIDRVEGSKMHFYGFNGSFGGGGGLLQRVLINGFSF